MLSSLTDAAGSSLGTQLHDPNLMDGLSHADSAVTIHRLLLRMHLKTCRDNDKYASLIWKP